MATPSTIEPPAGFVVDDPEPPAGFVADDSPPSPPAGFTLDDSVPPAAPQTPPEWQSAPIPKGLSKAQLQQMQINQRVDDVAPRAVESALNVAEPLVEGVTPAAILNTPQRLVKMVAPNSSYAQDVFHADTPIVQIPRAKGTGVLAGLENVGGGVLSSLTTPESIVTLPLAVQSRLVTAIFGTQMASQLPEEAQIAVKTLKDPNATTAEKVEAVGNPIVNTAMIAALAKVSGKKVNQAVEQIINANPPIPEESQNQQAPPGANGERPAPVIQPVPFEPIPPSAPPADTGISEPVGGAAPSGEEIGKKIGARYEGLVDYGNGNPQLRFTLNDPNRPGMNDTFHVPVDATPEQIQAKAEQMRKPFESDATFSVQPDPTVPGKFNIVTPSGRIEEEFPAEKGGEAAANKILPQYNPKITTPSEVDAILAKKSPPGVHGGAQEDLPPDQQAISKANNSREAFARVQAEADAKKQSPTPAPATKTPVSDVEVIPPESKNLPYYPRNLEVIQQGIGKTSRWSVVDHDKGTIISTFGSKHLAEEHLANLKGQTITDISPAEKQSHTAKAGAVNPKNAPELVLGEPKAPAQSLNFNEPWTMTKADYLKNRPDKSLGNEVAESTAKIDAKKRGSDYYAVKVKDAVRNTADKIVTPDRWQVKRKLSDEEKSADHREWVEAALKKGKQVPPEVLADYPDLQKQAPAQSPSIQSPFSAFGKSYYKTKDGSWRQKGKPSEKVNSSTVEALDQLLKRGSNDVSDWTSATAEAAEGGEPQELHAGIPMPKFKNRKMSELDKVTAEHSAKLQKSFDEARRVQREINKEVPNEKKQNAITIYNEAGGDLAQLKFWHDNAKQQWMRDAAADAMRLTPKELAIGNKAKSAFSILGNRGSFHNVLKSFVDNYVPHIWNVKNSKGGFGFGNALKARFKFSKARTFTTFFDGDQAGFKPKTLAIGKLLPTYIHEMNKVIADRQFVRDLSKHNASDSRPLVSPRGNSRAVESDEGKATLVTPRTPIEDTEDYRTMDTEPALSNWTWKGKDTAGNPVFIKSDLALHPEAYRRIKAVTGRSGITEWYRDNTGGISQIPKALVHGLDVAQSTMKREMFGFLAPFHQVQEGTHAIGHLVNPFFGIPKIDLRDAGQMDAANHGLMLMPDRASASSYMEGVGAKSSFISQGLRHATEAGKMMADVIDGYQDYLFHQYIPGLKYKTYQAMLGRNMKLYDAELKSGKITVDDVKLTSAEQANAAFGHLNKALLDRNPTIQHFMQLGLLAPDFLEARARFVGQAFKGLGSKTGHEQLRAIATLAAIQAGAAFTLSNLIGGTYDPKHPFEVIYKGRRYSMRSVPEDLFNLIADTRRFVYGRINPLIVKGGVQLATGLNYRGEKVSAKDTIEELLAGYIPITARAVPALRSLTETGKNQPVSPLEQLSGALGLRISRYSPISETYKLASKWKQANGIAEDTGSYPISKYQQLRYALEDGDIDRAKAEYQELLKTEKSGKIRSGFRESINHPFTGNESNDRKFASSLKPDDKKMYDYAKQKKREILNAFNSVR